MPDLLCVRNLSCGIYASSMPGHSYRLTLRLLPLHRLQFLDHQKGCKPNTSLHRCAPPSTVYERLARRGRADPPEMPLGKTHSRTTPRPRQERTTTCSHNDSRPLGSHPQRIPPSHFDSDQLCRFDMHSKTLRPHLTANWLVAILSNDRHCYPDPAIHRGSESPSPGAHRRSVHDMRSAIHHTVHPPPGISSRLPMSFSRTQNGPQPYYGQTRSSSPSLRGRPLMHRAGLDAAI